MVSNVRGFLSRVCHIHLGLPLTSNWLIKLIFFIGLFHIFKIPAIHAWIVQLRNFITVFSVRLKHLPLIFTFVSMSLSTFVRTLNPILCSYPSTPLPKSESIRSLIPFSQTFILKRITSTVSSWCIKVRHSCRKPVLLVWRITRENVFILSWFSTILPWVILILFWWVFWGPSKGSSVQSPHCTIHVWSRAVITFLSRVEIGSSCG